MDRHAEIAPLNTSFVNSTQFPSPCGNGGAESGKRAGMPPPRRSFLPPLPPYAQIPKTRQPIGSQNFIPGASLPQSISQPSPVFSFGAFPPMSSSPSSNNKAALPPLPFTRPTTSGPSGSSLPPEKVHRRAYSDNVSVLNSLMPQSDMRLIYPQPMEMPVGATNSNEGHKAKKSRGEVADFMDEYVTAYDELDDVSDDDDVEIISGDWEDERRATSGVKRRAGKEIAPSGRYSRSVSLDFTLNGMSTFESPELPPSPGNASGLEIQQGVFSVAEMETIESSEKLKGLAVSDPKHVKRILANRKSAARSKEKKTKHLNELRGRVEALQKEAARLSANNMLLDRSKSEVDEENKQLKIRVQGLEDQAKLRDALINQLTGEVQRLKVATGEVMQNLSGFDGSNTQSLDADMFEQLKINQKPQLNLGFE